MKIEKTEKVPDLGQNEVKNRIRTLFLRNYNIKQIQAEMDISGGTWDSCYYLNTHGFRDWLFEVKKERFLLKIEALSDDILDMDTENDAKLLAIKQKEAEFVRETLLKDRGYTKRVETIGLNINKNEPLDQEQRERLDKMLSNVA